MMWNSRWNYRGQWQIHPSAYGNEFAPDSLSAFVLGRCVVGVFAHLWHSIPSIWICIDCGGAPVDSLSNSHLHYSHGCIPRFLEFVVRPVSLDRLDTVLERVRGMQ